MNITKLSLNTIVALMLTVFALDLCYGDSVSAADRQRRRQAMARSDHLIVPGERIGPIRIGMGMDEVMATLGHPDWRQTATQPWERGVVGDTWYYTDLNMSISFSVGTTPSVRGVDTLANSYKSGGVKLGVMTWSDFKPVATVFHTDDGIKLGVSSFEVRRAFSSYSYKDDSLWMMYQSLGISFLVTRDYRICRIGINSPE